MDQDELEVEDANSKATNQDELEVVDRNSKAMNQDELEVEDVNSTATNQDELAWGPDQFVNQCDHLLVFNGRTILRVEMGWMLPSRDLVG